VVKVPDSVIDSIINSGERSSEWGGMLDKWIADQENPPRPINKYETFVVELEKYLSYPGRMHEYKNAQHKTPCQACDLLKKVRDVINND